MNFLKFFEKNRKKENLRKRDIPITPPVSDPLLRALIEGETITREKALTLPAVAGAVDLISSTIASMPVKLYKYKQGKVEEQDNDPRVRLLNNDTGDTLDPFQFKKAIVEDYLMGKGGYAYIRKFRNRVTGLFYVKDIFISVIKNFKPIFKDYVILVEGQEYKPYEFVKLLRKTTDGATGIGVTQELSKALETAYQTLIYQLGLVKSGGNKKGFLKSIRKLGQDEINVLKTAWQNLYANNESNVVVLNNGLRDLLLEKEKKNLFFEFDVKEIIKANIKERYEAYKLAKESSFMTINEIRKAENMEYIEGLDVVNVGLGAVLYDTNTHQYYTPNTNVMSQAKMEKVIEDKEIDTAFEESGNSSL